MLYKDEETWQLFRSGDLNGFEQLYEQYSQPLYAYGMKIVSQREIVEDMIHDLFTALWLRNGRLPDLSNVKFYLFKALRNKLLKQLSAKKSVTLEELPEHAFPLTVSSEADYIQDEENAQLRIRLQKALQCLTTHQREVLYLKFNEGLSYAEIAEITQINYQSVVNLVYRAMNVLRNHMGAPLALLIMFLGKLVIR